MDCIYNSNNEQHSAKCTYLNKLPTTNKEIIYKEDSTNISEIKKFVDGFWQCTLCGGYGEY